MRLGICLIVIGIGAPEAGADPKNKVKPTKAGAARVAPSAAGTSEAFGAKVIQYRDHDVPQIRTKLRYTTLIVLPADEVILDFVCGDKDLWVINGDQNFAYVKPAKENAQTNLNLVTASGHVYSFTLTEVTGSVAISADLKVFIQWADVTSAGAAAAASRRFVSVQELEDYRAQLEACRADTQRVRDRSEAATRGNASTSRRVFRFSSGAQL